MGLRLFTRSGTSSDLLRDGTGSDEGPVSASWLSQEETFIPLRIFRFIRKMRIKYELFF